MILFLFIFLFIGCDDSSTSKSDGDAYLPDADEITDTETDEENDADEVTDTENDTENDVDEVVDMETDIENDADEVVDIEADEDQFVPECSEGEQKVGTGIVSKCVDSRWNVVRKTVQFGTEETDVANSSAIDNAGNIYIAGTTGGDLYSAKGGLADIFLTKYDAAGNKLWGKQIGNGASEHAFFVAVDSTGNIYVAADAGDAESSLYGPIVGRFDVVLIKFDSDGNELWAKQAGSANIDYPVAITVDSNDNVYVAGDTYADLYGENLGSIDYFIVKYDSAGNELWAKHFGTAYADYVKSIASDSQGNIYVTGNTTANDGYKNRAVDYDAFIVKYDSNGNKVWGEMIGLADSNESANVVNVDDSDNVYISGSTTGSIFAVNAGESDILFIKYDAGGNNVFAKQFGTWKSETVTSFDFASNNTFYFTGTANIIASQSSIHGFFLAEFDVTDDSFTPLEFSVDCDDVSSLSVSAGSNGNIYLTGAIDGTIDSSVSYGDVDAFLSVIYPE